MFAFHLGYHRLPVIVDWFFSGPGTPGALEDIVQQEHRHVAADTVTLFGHFRDRLNHRLPELWSERVELEHIWPSREIRIPPTRKYISASLEEGCELSLKVCSVS